MKSIAFIITRSELGGAQEYVRILMESLNDINVILIVGEEGFLCDYARGRGNRVFVCRHLVQPVRPLQDFLAVQEIYRILRREKPGLVHANSSKAGLLSRIAAYMAGIPLVFTAHGWSFTEGVGNRQRRLYRMMEKLSAPLAEKIICVSSYDRNLALRCRVGNEQRLRTIHNGITDCEAGPAGQQDGHEWHEGTGRPLRVTMVARFCRQKDYLTCLKAVSLAAPGQLAVRLVGDGPELSEMRRLCTQWQLNDRVSFLGLRQDIDRILQDSDVFMLLSRWEGLPISILEAMRAGLPVIATATGGIPEAVQDGVNGMLVERGDAHAAYRALIHLADDPKLRQRMGRAGRERYQRLFTADRMVADTLQVYEECLVAARATRPLWRRHA